MQKNLITLVVVGVAACVGLMNFISTPKTGVSFLQSIDDDNHFARFIAKYGRSYGTKEEYLFRRNQFYKKLAEYEEHNSRNDVTFTLGINKFSDYTPQEYKRLLGYRPSNIEIPEIYLQETNAITVDWRQKGAVTPIKDQGNCGSCWSFSSTGAMEGHHKIASGQLLSLSEQQLIDCSTSYGNEGCDGGDMVPSFQYAQKYLMQTESTYPYEGRDRKCRYQSSLGKVKVTSYARVPKKSPEQLKAAIAKGPVAVGVDSSSALFEGYSRGIINTSRCGTDIDHAVLAVGYGSENGQEFYIVKNSFGTDWGENGYVRIAIVDGAGICGIQLVSSWPTTN